MSEVETPVTDPHDINPAPVADRSVWGMTLSILGLAFGVVRRPAPARRTGPTLR